MRANKLETAVCSMPFCSGTPDFFMYMCHWVISFIKTRLVCLYTNVHVHVHVAKGVVIYSCTYLYM